MDAYSVSYTSPSRRASSRIYQDLASCTSSRYINPNAGLGGFAMNSDYKIRTLRPSKPPRICIIGGGISGLRCADVLLQHGFDVTIFEARDRLGGRMHQATLSTGHTVDLGPNWIHGTDHNPILDLAKETQTHTHKWEDVVNVFGDDGELLRDRRELTDVMWSIIGEAFKHSAKNSSTIDANESLYDFFKIKVEEKFPSGEGHEQKRKGIFQLSELWGAFVGSPIQTQSLKFFWLEECIDGENLFCAGTYKKILDKIAVTAMKYGTIRLSHAVTGIESSGNSVRVLGADQTEEFDEVVVTVPLGWLKGNKAAFNPPLPDRFHSAIDAIGYGSLEKVYITFPRAFWLNADATPAEQFTGFTQWLAPLYALDTNPNRWNQESVDLSTLPEGCAHPTLLYYIYGHQSAAFSNILSTFSSNRDRDEYLIQFFLPYFSRLPNYSEDSPDCKPVSCLATSWIRDEYAGYGSYSTFRTGLEEGDKDIEIMREGLPGRGLWFAGEHTSPFVAVGTVTGAYWSGEAVGKRIAGAYGLLQEKEKDIPELDTILSSDDSSEINVRGFGETPLEI